MKIDDTLSIDAIRNGSVRAFAINIRSDTQAGFSLFDLCISVSGISGKNDRRFQEVRRDLLRTPEPPLRRGRSGYEADRSVR